jgi:hypothetical protein
MDLLLIFLDSDTKQVVWFKFIRSETVSEYNEGLHFLFKHNFKILSATIDGRKGIKELFLRNGISVQICQFHQILTVSRYLTSSPKLIPSLQLKTIVEDLTISNYTSFKSRFDYYLEANEEFINERSVNPISGRKIFTHKKLRSAIRSIQTNLPYLFTYQVNVPYADFQLKLTHKVTSEIPNTTNHIDGGVNPKIRELVRSHRGMRKDRRNKLLSVLLASLGSS